MALAWDLVGGEKAAEFESGAKHVNRLKGHVLHPHMVVAEL